MTNPFYYGMTPPQNLSNDELMLDGFPDPFYSDSPPEFVDLNNNIYPNTQFINSGCQEYYNNQQNLNLGHALDNRISNPGPEYWDNSVVQLVQPCIEENAPVNHTSYCVPQAYSSTNNASMEGVETGNSRAEVNYNSCGNSDNCCERRMNANTCNLEKNGNEPQGTSSSLADNYLPAIGAPKKRGRKPLIQTEEEREMKRKFSNRLSQKKARDRREREKDELRMENDRLRHELDSAKKQIEQFQAKQRRKY